MLNCCNVNQSNIQISIQIIILSHMVDHINHAEIYVWQKKIKTFYFLGFGTDLLSQNELLVEVIASSLCKMETIFHAPYQCALTVNVYETIWPPQKTKALHISTRRHQTGADGYTDWHSGSPSASRIPALPACPTTC